MDAAVNPCEEFEIAALLRARRALDSAALVRLNTHLAGCSGCRRYAATAVATETALRRRVREAATTRNLATIRERFRRRHVHQRALMLWFVVVIDVDFALFWWSLGAEFALWATGATAVVLAGVYVVLILPARRQERLAAATEVDLLRYYRKALDAEIAGHRMARSMLPFMAVVFGLVALAASMHGMKESVRGHDIPNWRFDITMAVTNGLNLAGLWYRSRVLLSRRERERKELA
jgi:hypothetical protein